MKRVALRILIVSVAISALLGIYALVVGEFGSFEARILGTALTISGASILSMACGVAWERSRLGRLPSVGVLLAVAAGALLVVGIWGETTEDAFWKTVFSVSIPAIAMAHASLLSLASLERRFSWSVRLAYSTAFVLAVALIVLVWSEWDEELAWRAIGVLAVLLSAFTILVPVFHRMSRPEDGSDRREARFCPACGSSLASGAGASACERCGARCRIEFLES